MRGYRTVKLKKPVNAQCDSCHGRGQLDKDYDIFDCPWCDGTGRVKVTERTIKVKPLGKTRHVVTLVYVEDRHIGDDPKQRGRDWSSRIKDALWRAGLKPTKITLRTNNA